MSLIFSNYCDLKGKKKSGGLVNKHKLGFVCISKKLLEPAWDPSLRSALQVEEKMCPHSLLPPNRNRSTDGGRLANIAKFKGAQSFLTQLAIFMCGGP